MIKNWLKKKMEIINEKKKNNEGFTLVELIVVIVILAILIGVTIGGIYMYVGQARKNTDANNKNALETTLSTLATNDAAYAWSNVDTAVTAEISITQSNGTVTATYPTGSTWCTESEITKLLPNGFPVGQSDTDGYKVTFTGKDGSISVDCTLGE